MPDGSLVPWTSPSTACRCGSRRPPPKSRGATSPIRSRRTAASSTTSPTRLHRPDGDREAVVQQRPLYRRHDAGRRALLRPGSLPVALRPTSSADVTSWKARIEQGEPYDGDPASQAVLDEIKAHHSAYYIDHSEPPAPLLISNGFTDDLFPADEAIGYFNRIRSQYPNAPISLFFGDFGHMRAQQQEQRHQRTDGPGERLDGLLRQGHRLAAVPGRHCVRAHLSLDADVDSLRALPGRQLGRAGEGRRPLPRHRLEDDLGERRVGECRHDVRSGAARLGRNPCATASGDDLPGVATYRLPAAAGSGYTLMGSPTVVATIGSPVANSEIAARLLDVAPDGTETLVARQLYRPQVGTARQVFQLHPSGHLFAAGTSPKLELLPKDAGGANLNSYGRPANGQGDVTISNLDLRLPVLEGPGAAGGQVEAAPPAAAPLRPGDRAPVLLRFLRPRHARHGQAEAEGEERQGSGRFRPGQSALPGPDQAARQEVQEEGQEGHGSQPRRRRRTRRSGSSGKATATIAGGQSGS